MKPDLKSIKIFLYLGFLSLCVAVLSFADRTDYVIKIAMLIPISLMIGTFFYWLYDRLRS